MRVGRQPAAGMAVLLAEPVELVGRQPALQEGAGVDARGGVTLDEHLIPATGMGLTTEEVVEAHLVERRGRRVRGDVPAHPHTWTLRPVHHDRRVPPDPCAKAAFDVLVAGKPRLKLGGDRVDVVGGRQRRIATRCSPARSSSRSIR